jgi:hypothetical protein
MVRSSVMKGVMKVDKTSIFTLDKRVPGW